MFLLSCCKYEAWEVSNGVSFSLNVCLERANTKKNFGWGERRDWRIKFSCRAFFFFFYFISPFPPNLGSLVQSKFWKRAFINAYFGTVSPTPSSLFFTHTHTHLRTYTHISFSLSYTHKHTHTLFLSHTHAKYSLFLRHTWTHLHLSHTRTSTPPP